MDDSQLTQSNPNQTQGTSVSPQQPVSTPIQKEYAPIPTATASFGEIQEIVSPSERRIELSKEEKAAGVEHSQEEPELTQDQKAAGVVEAKEATPVQLAPVAEVQIAGMTKAKAQQTVKGLGWGNASNAIIWLAMLVLRAFQIKESEEKRT